ncbi:MAG: VTC domain-containing protein [Bacteroidales bacterium]|nr:VTC domain-containing protein [Bacteroidales bacterium]
MAIGGVESGAGNSLQSTYSSWSALLARFDPITLDEMESITLMNRIDSKYLTDVPTLLRLLGDAAEQGYRALYVDGKKLIPYDSVYFDTPDLKTYTDHRNRRLVRQKIRTRCYLTASGPMPMWNCATASTSPPGRLPGPVPLTQIPHSWAMVLRTSTGCAALWGWNGIFPAATPSISICWSTIATRNTSPPAISSKASKA